MSVAVSAIAETAPELTSVVQDLARVVVAAKTERASATGRNGGKVRFEAHGFFEPQPVKDADVYLLRFI